MILRNLKRKRLNNKGFTLIELLAVVVILAVVMGIAMTSVLSAMNKSRGGSLADSAMVLANGFNQKYTESLVGGVPNDIYAGRVNGYNFQSDATYYIDSALADEFNISGDSYALGTVGAVTSSDTTGIGTSFVKFDASTGKFIVCMFANKSGSYYVDNYKTPGIVQVGSTGVYAAAGEMFACSDGVNSWETESDGGTPTS